MSRPSVASISHPAPLIAAHVAAYAAVAAALAQGAAAAAVWAVAFASIAIWISVVDFRHMIVPDLAALALAAAALARIWAEGADPLAPLAAALLWGGLFWMAARAFQRVRGHPGLGFGDVKLVAALGLWLGPQGTSLAVLGAALGGIAAMVAAQRLGGAARPLREGAIAFGPFLCLAGWAIFLSGATR